MSAADRVMAELLLSVTMNVSGEMASGSAEARRATFWSRIYLRAISASNGICSTRECYRDPHLRD